MAQRGVVPHTAGTSGTQVSDVKSKSVDPGFDYMPADFNDGAAFLNFSGNIASRADPGFQFTDTDFIQSNGHPY